LSQAWANLPERGSQSALALIWWIAAAIGRPVGRLLLHPISLYFLITAGPQRRASRRYLRRALGRQVGLWHVYRHILCFAQTILDRAFLLTGSRQPFDIRPHDGGLIDAQLATGRGCLLLGAHLGSFEALRVLGFSHRGLPLKVLMNVDHNPSITRFLNGLNPGIARTIIPIDGPGTLLAVKEHLDAGFLVATLGDRVVPDGKATVCRFLGGEAHFPVGPIQVAIMTGAPVILAFALYRGGNRYDVHFERLTDGIPAADRRRADVVQAWTQRYADRLAHYTSLAPYNWFNFFDFWDEAAEPAQPPALSCLPAGD
jgi:predicted LPLAT superfamily acyltransferase